MHKLLRTRRKRIVTVIPADSVTSWTGSVTSLWTGNAVPDGVTVSAHVTQSSTLVRLVVSTASDLSNPIYSEAATTTAIVNNTSVTSYIAKPVITGLQADTQYHYGLLINGNLKNTIQGKFKTPPFNGTATNFRIGFASCCDNASNHTIFNTIRTLATPIVAFQHMGDMHYGNPASNSTALFYTAYEGVFASANQSQLWREFPMRYVYDDHDFGGDDSYSTAAAKPAAIAAYKVRVPHPPLGLTSTSDPICYTYQIGRIVFVVTDARSQKQLGSTSQSANVTVLGSTQKQWFKDTLTNSAYANCAFIWVMSNPFHSNATALNGTANDDWSAFWLERAELADFFKQNGLYGRIAIISGDMHALAAESGANSNYSTQTTLRGAMPIPIMHAAPLDQGNSIKGGTYSVGTWSSGMAFGVIDFTDTGGSTISAVYRGLDSAGTQQLTMTSTLRASAAPPVVTASQSFPATVATASGATLGTVATTEGWPASFSITAGNSAGYYAISSGGVITTTQTSIPAATYTLTVQATNAGGSNSATVTSVVSSGATLQQPAVRQSAAVSPDLASQTTLAISLPSVAIAGNLILLSVNPEKVSGAINTPSGFTSAGTGVINAPASTGGINGALFYKIAAGGEQTFNPTWTNAVRGAAMVAEVTNVDTTSPISRYTAANGNVPPLGAVTSSITAGPVTTTAADENFAMAFWSLDSETSTMGLTAWGFTDSFVVERSLLMPSPAGGPQPPLVMGRKVLSTTGNVQTTFSYTTGVSDDQVLILVVLRGKTA